MKVLKIVFWPYQCVEQKEMKPLVKTSSKSDVGNGRTRHHALAGWLATRTDTRHASHASSSPGWADPTRIPVDPTHVPASDKMTSSCTVGMPWQRPVIWHVSIVGPICHVISRAQPSCVGAEPRDKILHNGVYVQPDLRLNLGRSSDHNCLVKS